MTQITKEQLEEALTDVGLDTIDLDVIRSYITQLEANQRQPVSNEKLRGAVEWLKDATKSYTHREKFMTTIESALSELDTLRSASKWQPIETAPRDGSYFIAWFEGAEIPALICWHNERWEDNEMSENNGDGEFLGEFVWQPLPTPPAQEV